jgi:quinol-cytochrome oxidoreductase complex cytochrome b subunit
MQSHKYAKNALLATAIGGILPALTVASIWALVAIFLRPVSVAEWMTALIAFSSVIPAALISVADPSSRAKVAFSWILPGILLVVTVAGLVAVLADGSTEPGEYRRYLALYGGMTAAQIWGMIFGSIAQAAYRKSDSGHGHEERLRRGFIAG